MGANDKIWSLKLIFGQIRQNKLCFCLKWDKKYANEDRKYTLFKEKAMYFSECSGRFYSLNLNFIRKLILSSYVISYASQVNASWLKNKTKKTNVFVLESKKKYKINKYKNTIMIVKDIFKVLSWHDCVYII